MRKLTKLQDEAFSLLEVVLTLLIIAVALVGASDIFSTGWRGTIKDKSRLIACNLAQDMMEEVSSKNWGSSTAIPAVPLANTRNPAWEVIDDYNNFTETPPHTIDNQALDGRVAVPLGGAKIDYSSFQRNVTVSYWDPAALKTTTNPTDYKCITVNVLYSAQKSFATPNFTYTITTIMTNH